MGSGKETIECNDFSLQRLESGARQGTGEQPVRRSMAHHRTFEERKRQRLADILLPAFSPSPYVIAHEERPAFLPCFYAIAQDEQPSRGEERRAKKDAGTELVDENMFFC